MSATLAPNPLADTALARLDQDGRLLTPVHKAPTNKPGRVGFRGELALRFAQKLADEARPPELTCDQVMATAREIAGKAPVAVAGSKAMINYARDHTIADGLDYIATWQTGMFSGPHMAEAFAAKKEGRETRFPDLLPLRRGL